MSDFPTDESDRATDIEVTFRDAAIAAVRVKYSPPESFDGKHCVECEDEIPTGRLSLGRWTCIYCQELKERNYGRR